MKVKKAHLFLIVFLAAAALLIAYAFTFGKNKNGAPGKGKPGKSGSWGAAGNTEFSVVTKTAEPETLHGYIVANGEIESQNSVSVYPNVSGIWSSSRLSCGECLLLRCDGKPGNSFPTMKGKDPSSRATRRKRGSAGCGWDPRPSSRVEMGMSENFLTCSKGVKDPFEVPEVSCD